MNYPITIVAAIVDVHNLTMYRADGETITIKQGDPRIRDLVGKLVPALDMPGGVYLLTEEDLSGKNHFAEAEKKSNGLVRFFKMAKSKLKEIADKFCEPVEPMEIGSLSKREMEHTVNGVVLEPEVVDPTPVKPAEEDRPLTKSASAVAEIMANAQNTTAYDFSAVVDEKQANSTGKEEQVIVAVMADNTVIPGAQHLEAQMQAVSEGLTSSVGMQRFFERAATVTRGHSVEDLLKFIQKGELPLADDGSVLVYKRLKATKDPEVFVDVHSGNVKQRVGSFVHMAENMVDKNRHQDCSHGLHVARRDYLRTFSGDVTVLAKLAPEDVIAVPSYDARKLRAKGYHIIARLSAEDASLVCSNQPMQDTELLANAVAGNHVGITEYVEITLAQGGGLKITPASEVGTVPQNEVRAVTSLDEMAGVSEETSKVDARALALDLASGKDSTAITTVKGDEVVDVQVFHAPPGNMTVSGESLGEATPPPKPPKATAVPRSKVDVLMDSFTLALDNVSERTAAQALLDFKKKSKKSWTALGISASVVDKLKGFEAASKAMAVAQPVMAPKPVAKVKVTKKGNTTVVKATAGKGVDLRDVIGVPAVKKAAPPKPPVSTVTNPVTTKNTPKAVPKEGKPVKRTQAEEAAHLLAIYTKNPDYQNAKEIVAFKKGTKKGWKALGVDEALGKRLETRVKL